MRWSHILENKDVNIRLWHGSRGGDTVVLSRSAHDVIASKARGEPGIVLEPRHTVISSKEIVHERDARTD